MLVRDKRRKESNVDIVNSLLEKSFGKGFRGNYKLDSSDPSGECYWKRVNYLDKIAKSICISTNLVGCFEKGGDGSTINVGSDCFSNAKTYAQLYKEKIGKEVTINIVNDYEQDYQELCLPPSL